MVAKATIDLLVITFVSWLMLISVSFAIAFVLQEMPRSSSLSDIRSFIGMALIALWLFAWFKLVSSYFWKTLKKNYKNNY